MKNTKHSFDHTTGFCSGSTIPGFVTMSKMRPEYAGDLSLTVTPLDATEFLPTGQCRSPAGVSVNVYQIRP